MPPGRGLQSGPGPWSPQLNDKSVVDGLAASGPSNLDIACKDALLQMLKPSNYPVIMPWIHSASSKEKRNMVKLARCVSTADKQSEDPVIAFRAFQQPVVVNSHGRTKLADSIHITADRLQSDLLRSRSGSDQRDRELQKKRELFSAFHAVPSRDSIADFCHLGVKPIAGDAAAQVLTEHVRNRLQQWQVRAPERDRQETADVMRSLRDLSNSVQRRPRRAVGSACAAATRARSSSSNCSTVPRSFVSPSARDDGLMQHSFSSPAILRPLIDPEDIMAIHRPGGFMVRYSDHPQLQRMKNKSRAIKSTMSVAGKNDYTTSSSLIGRALV